MKCEKVRYGSQVFAEYDLKRIARISFRSKIPVRAYKCDCGWWHLTSQNSEKDLKIALLESELLTIRDEVANLRKGAGKEDRVAAKVNEMVVEMKDKNNKLQKENKNLRETISELVRKLQITHEANIKKEP